jgi:DNA-binding sugar fermentation-stimulating protein
VQLLESTPLLHAHIRHIQTEARTSLGCKHLRDVLPESWESAILFRGLRSKAKAFSPDREPL